MANTVKLQGIYGAQEGTPAKDLKVGDIIVWNYGYKSEVVDITPSKSGKTITFMLKSFESGNINSRKMGADRLVVVEPREPEKPKNEIDRAISERENTYFGIYSDVGTALEKFTTEELSEYYLKRFGDGGLRYFLEKQIIAAEIAKEKNILGRQAYRGAFPRRSFKIKSGGLKNEKIYLFPMAANPPKKSYTCRKSLLVRLCGCFVSVPVDCTLYRIWILTGVLEMSECQKVIEMTKTLVNMFPDLKNDLEKEKYYFEHNYYTFFDWEESVIKIISIAA